jgi:hypothetical protein
MCTTKRVRHLDADTRVLIIMFTRLRHRHRHRLRLVMTTQLRHRLILTMREEYDVGHCFLEPREGIRTFGVLHVWQPNCCYNMYVCMYECMHICIYIQRGICTSCWNFDVKHTSAQHISCITPTTTYIHVRTSTHTTHSHTCTQTYAGVSEVPGVKEAAGVALTPPLRARSGSGPLAGPSSKGLPPVYVYVCMHTCVFTCMQTGHIQGLRGAYAYACMHAYNL